jgi:hypothetical protein
MSLRQEIQDSVDSESEEELLKTKMLDSAFEQLLSSLIAKGLKQIFVKGISGKTLTIDLEAFDTIASLKAKIFVQEGVPPDQQRLIFEGKQLEEAVRIASSDLRNESTVFLTLNLHGGAKKLVNKDTKLKLSKESFNDSLKAMAQVMQGGGKDVAGKVKVRLSSFIGNHQKGLTTILKELEKAESVDLMQLITPLGNNDQELKMKKVGEVLFKKEMDEIKVLENDLAVLKATMFSATVHCFQTEYLLENGNYNFQKFVKDFNVMMKGKLGQSESGGMDDMEDMGFSVGEVRGVPWSKLGCSV